MDPKDTQNSLEARDALFSTGSPKQGEDDWAELKSDSWDDTAGHKAAGMVLWGTRKGEDGKFRANSGKETLGAVWICASPVDRRQGALFVVERRRRIKASDGERKEGLAFTVLNLAEMIDAKLSTSTTQTEGQHPCLEIDFIDSSSEADGDLRKVVQVRCPMQGKPLRAHVSKMEGVLLDYMEKPEDFNQLTEWKEEARMPETVRLLFEQAKNPVVAKVGDGEGEGRTGRDRQRRPAEDLDPDVAASPMDRETKRVRKRSRSPPPRRPASPPGALQGFRNLGNTCYMSSVVSVLALLRPFANDDPPPEGSILAALCRAMRATRDKGRGVQDLSDLRAALCARRPQFRGSQQHDAHELYTALVSLTVGELRRRERERRGAAARRSFEVPGPDTNFRFTLEAERTCSVCKRAGKRKSDTSWCWSLNVAEEDECCYYADGVYYYPTLEQLIETNISPEKVQCTCDKEGCGGKEALQQLYIGQMPRFLVLNVNRFSVSDDGKTTRKKSTPVTLCPELDLCHLTGIERTEGGRTTWVGIGRKPVSVSQDSKLEPFPEGPWRLPQPDPVIDLDEEDEEGYTAGKDEDEDLQRALAASIADSQGQGACLGGASGEGDGMPLEKRGPEGPDPPDAVPVAIADEAEQSEGEASAPIKSAAVENERKEEQDREEVMQPKPETASGSEDEEEDEEDEDDDLPEINKAKYLLHAVVSHVGQTSGSGHYVSDVRDPDTGNWLRFNDSRLVTGGYTKKALHEYWKTNAYMVFYSFTDCYKKTGVGAGSQAPPQ